MWLRLGLRGAPGLGRTCRSAPPHTYPAMGSLAPSRHLGSHPCPGTLSPSPAPLPAQGPPSCCSCCWPASTAVPTPGSTPPSAAVYPQSCAACSAVPGGVPHLAWDPKRSPVPLPVPSWPRTLPPEKPGGAFPSRSSSKLSCLPGAGPGSHWERASPYWELALDYGGRGAEVSSLSLGMGRGCSSMAVTKLPP